jgi:hypothetical protein
MREAGRTLAKKEVVKITLRRADPAWRNRPWSRGLRGGCEVTLDLCFEGWLGGLVGRLS